MSIVRGFTKEAGVRELERLMNTIARKTATEVVTEDIKEGRKFTVTEKNLEKYSPTTARWVLAHLPNSIWNWVYLHELQIPIRPL